MNNFSNINKLSGFKDKFSDSLIYSNKLRKDFSDFVEKWGYEQVSTPILERSDLFTSKTGTSLTNNIYSFTDPSGVDVSLRPDFTSSIMRMIIEKEIDYSKHSIRFSYSGDIFRYSPNENNYISQNGIELIGTNNITSDVEVLSIAMIFSSRIMPEEVFVRVGHVGILMDIFKFYKMSDRESLFILQNLDFISSETSIESVFSKAKDFGIFINDDSNTTKSKDLSDEEISNMLDFAFSNDNNFKQTRDKDSIIKGILNNFEKQSNSKKFSECVSTISKLINIDANLEEGISLANEILAGVPVKKNLSDFYQIVKNLENYEINISNIKIDFGLVREWGYYSGFVFDLYSKGFGEKNSFGGGGRYDYLSKSGIIPATGFAIDSEKILNNNSISFSVKNTKKIIVYAKNNEDYDLAQKTCFDERNIGNIVLLETSEKNIEELRVWSKENNFSEIISVSQNKIDRIEV